MSIEIKHIEPFTLAHTSVLNLTEQRPLALPTAWIVEHSPIRDPQRRTPRLPTLENDLRPVPAATDRDVCAIGEERLPEPSKLFSVTAAGVRQPLRAVWLPLYFPVSPRCPACRTRGVSRCSRGAARAGLSHLLLRQVRFNNPRSNGHLKFHNKLYSSATRAPHGPCRPRCLDTREPLNGPWD